MNKSIFILVILFYVLLSLNGQTRIDSLENELKNLPADTNRVNFLCELSFDIFTSSPEKAEQYAFEAIELGKKLNFERGVGRAYSKLAITYHIRGNHERAFENYQNALESYTKIDDKLGVAKIFNNLGILFLDQSNYEKSLEYYLNALRVFEQKGIKISSAGVLNNIGEIYEKLGNQDKAFEYFNKSFEIYNGLTGYAREKAHVLINIGRINFTKNDSNSALNYYQQALNISLNLNDKYYIAVCKTNIGEIYFKKNNFSKALDYYNESLVLLEDIGDKDGIAACLLSIGKTYDKLDKTSLSKSYYRKSLDLAKKISAKEVVMSALEYMYNHELNSGNFLSALNYFKKYTALRDSIFSMETRNQLAELQTKYDTEKKEQENTRLRVENVLQDQTIQKQLYGSILVTVALLSMSIFALVFFKAQKKEKKTNLLLAEKNEQIKTTLEELQSTQEQLIQSEKMATLGQLTAGIAHEINNPINFITTSLQGLQMNLGELINLQKIFDSINSTNVKKKLKKILALKDDINFKVLLAELEELTENIFNGANRTSEIVQGLQAFSRLDETELKKVNIHDGIKSTILILEHQIPEQIKIQNEYDDLPDVPCYPGKLNQVFMNVINNAIQAIKNKKQLDKELIVIKTFLEKRNEKEYAVIKISDTGAGIPDNIKDKIFDPFFTTKDVGKGIGLGLSISRGIIESHNGIIEVDSKLGKGTSFTIMIPMSE
jgi:signal transduction histidine kinase/Tfp pilus assembly protein PilF